MLRYKNGEPYSKEQFQKDLNATPEAKLATIIYHEEYENFDYGIMTFWDQLDGWRKGVAKTNTEWIMGKNYKQKTNDPKANP